MKVLHNYIIYLEIALFSLKHCNNVKTESSNKITLTFPLGFVYERSHAIKQFPTSQCLSGLAMHGVLIWTFTLSLTKSPINFDPLRNPVYNPSFTDILLCPRCLRVMVGQSDRSRWFKCTQMKIILIQLIAQLCLYLLSI